MSEKAAVDVKEILTSDKLDISGFLTSAGALYGSSRLRTEAGNVLAKWGDFEGKFSKKSIAAVKRGYALWVLGKKDEALEVLSAVKSSEEGAYFFAFCLARMGRGEEAAEVLEKAASKGDAPEIPMLLAEIRLQRGELEAAAKLLKQLEKSCGSKPEFLYLSGYYDELCGEYGSAVEKYNKALASDEKHAKSRFRLAENLNRLGRDDEAVRQYEQMLENPPVYRSVVMNLGVLYEDNARYQKAMDCYDLVLKNDPTDERARLYRDDAQASLTMVVHEELEREQDKRNQILRTPVTDFELSVRSRNCLNKMQIKSLGDLIKKTEQELLSYKNFGETSLAEIKEMLTSKNLRLGMGREEAEKSARQQFAPRTAETGGKEELMSRSIDALELSVRSRKCMDRLGVVTVGELARCTEAHLLQVKNFGQTSLNEIKRKLADVGLSLGM